MTKDPVCGMSVDESKAAGTVVRDGQTYHFCSAYCKAEFEKRPEGTRTGSGRGARSTS